MAGSATPSLGRGPLLGRIDLMQRRMEKELRDLDRLPRPLDGGQGWRRIALTEDIDLLRVLYQFVQDGRL